MKYYPINEDLARRAKEMNSFSDYVPGSATQAYCNAVDEAAALAEQQKQRVDPFYHDKIDTLVDTYARKLAENINRSNEIASRVPSILIAGGGNFPVRKKEKQNRAADANMEEWRQIQGLLDKIKGTGMGGISADEPDAVGKLRIKLAGLEQLQETMKAVNAFYRKNKTLDNCPHLSAEEIEKLKASMARNWRAQPKPYESYVLSNNNASIRQVKARIEELTRQAETVYEGWKFDGGEVKMNRELNRLQVFFDEKPSQEICSSMRHGGFRWAPSVGAWQRQLNDNAIRAVKRLDCLQPMSEELPAHAQAEPVLNGPDKNLPPATLDSIANKYYEFQHLCYPLQKDAVLRQDWIKQVVQYIQCEGKHGTELLALTVAELAAQIPDNPTAQALATELIRDLDQYGEPERDAAPKQKAPHRKSRER